MTKYILFIVYLSLIYNSTLSQNFVGINTANNIHQKYHLGSEPVPIATAISTNLETYNNENMNDDCASIIITIKNPSQGDKLFSPSNEYGSTQIEEKIYYASNNASAFDRAFQDLIKNRVKFECTNRGKGYRIIEIKVRHQNYFEGTNHFYWCETNYNKNYRFFEAAIKAENRHQRYGLIKKDYLATITSFAENQYIHQLFAQNNSNENALAWFGASDVNQQGVWIWVDGSERNHQLDYTNWYRNILPSNGDYSVMNQSGKWLGMSCTPHSNAHIQSFIVEFGGMLGDRNIQMKQTVVIDIISNPKSRGVYFLY